MWYFNSPLIVFGEQALSHLSTLNGKRVCIISDANLSRLGYVDRVKSEFLPKTEVRVFDQVETDPSFETARVGANFLQEFNPDWIIALGGGSVIDAAKAMWILYENPDLEPAAINPLEEIKLRRKARFVAIPTTTGTGSEVTWAIVLTDPIERRKLALGNREAIADYAILDPSLIMDMPARLMADTGLDALTHGIEGFTTTWHNDFCDAMCLKAIDLIFKYLVRAVRDSKDEEARYHLQNAASIAGLGFGNAMAGLAHGLGHSLGAIYHVPHGRAVALFLPYTIEFSVNGNSGNTRYLELINHLGLSGKDEKQAATVLVEAIRSLQQEVWQPQTLKECGIDRKDLETELDKIVQNTLNDSQTIMGTRIPDEYEVKRLLLAAYDGELVDF